MNVCEKCETPLTPDEWLTGSCPFCGANVEDASAKQRPGKVSVLFRGDAVTIGVDERPGWATVRVGLGLGILGSVGVWVGFAIVFGANLLLDDLDLASPLLQTTRSAGAEVRVWSVFTVFTGYLLCIAVPRSSRCRRWIWASAGLAVLATILLLAYNYMYLENAEVAAARSSLSRFLNVGKTTEPGSLALPDHLRDPWSRTKINVTAYSFLSVVILAYLFLIVYLWSMARYLKRNSLSSAILLLFAGQMSLYTIAVLFQIYRPENLPEFAANSTLPNPPGEMTAIFLVFSLVVMTGYISCFVILRGCIARLIKGDSVTAPATRLHAITRSLPPPINR